LLQIFISFRGVAICTYVENVLGNEWYTEKIMKIDPVMEGQAWRLFNNELRHHI
jgi:hypothetical protein